MLNCSSDWFVSFSWRSHCLVSAVINLLIKWLHAWSHIFAQKHSHTLAGTLTHLQAHTYIVRHCVFVYTDMNTLWPLWVNKCTHMQKHTHKHTHSSSFLYLCCDSPFMHYDGSQLHALLLGQTAGPALSGCLWWLICVDCCGFYTRVLVDVRIMALVTQACLVSLQCTCVYVCVCVCVCAGGVGVIQNSWDRPDGVPMQREAWWE